MQNIKTQTQAVTAAQSLAAVQTVLRAGLGCITYLRDLLPEENFTNSPLRNHDSFSSLDSDSSMSSEYDTRNPGAGGFKIYTMTRGYSDEADKLLNYLENGIFDALAKQYLRSFIFGIYLDSKDPNSIVEAYTFNFHYHTLPDSSVSAPIMTLDSGMQKMSLKDLAHVNDPVSLATRSGRAPTLLDVKRSVKALIKRLIQAANSMDILPKRRFATFKVFYTDKTPADYEPPHFQAGDCEKDRWYFMTHDFDEIPETCGVGKADTGHHSVNVSVTSVATYLPSSNPKASQHGLKILTPMQEAQFRSQQAEEQSTDAAKRTIAWSVEGSVDSHDLDAEGEEDPDYTQLPDGSYQKIVKHDLETPTMVPLGVRDSSGAVVPLAIRGHLEEARFSGEAEEIPTRLNELISKAVEISEIEPTQEIGDFTPTDDMAPRSPSFDGIDSCRSTANANQATFAGEEIETLNLETQMEFIGISTIDKTPDDIGAPVPLSNGSNEMLHNGLQCNCEINIDGECVLCDGSCGKWFHVWCMGYHSARDPRIPSRFVCFDCRVRADFNWELIKINFYDIMIARFQELALFRRAIKIAETRKPESAADFTKAFGGTNILARQLFRRLEREGYVVEYFSTLDELGFPTTKTRSAKKGKQPKTRRNVQKSQFRLNRQALQEAGYLDYFNPDPKVESRVLRLAELVHDHPILYQRMGESETQTQEETMALALGASKRPSSEAQERVHKKMKISLAQGLDLAV